MNNYDLCISAHHFSVGSLSFNSLRYPLNKQNKKPPLLVQRLAWAVSFKTFWQAGRTKWGQNILQEIPYKILRRTTLKQYLLLYKVIYVCCFVFWGAVQRGVVVYVSAWFCVFCFCFGLCACSLVLLLLCFMYMLVCVLVCIRLLCFMYMLVCKFVCMLVSWAGLLLGGVLL